MPLPSLRHSRRGAAVLRTSEQVAVRRIRWTLAIFAVLVLATTAKLVEIQVLDAADLAAVSERQRARTIELPATRGRIYDRDGDVLATSVQAATVYADPRAFRATETPDGLEVPAAATAGDVAAALAPVLSQDAATITERLEEDRHFVYLARQVAHEVGEDVRALGLPGIGVLVEPHRLYPAGPLAGQVVGFTDIDAQGLQGLESVYDGVLSGTPGTLLLERAPGGLDIASGVRELSPPAVGTDVVLSLDREVQHVAELAATMAMEEYDAVGASIVVTEVGTGDILAMASTPGFDPNERGDEDPSDRRNRAVTDVFEPGSTQKALTIAAAVEEGIVAPSTTMSVADNISVSGSTFTDSSSHATSQWTVTEIMERSSNVGTIQIAQALGPEQLDAYLRSFGYGRPTALGFPGESGGLLRHHEDWWGTSLPTIAMGHGVAVTLLQLAHSYGTIANDGVAVSPRLVRGTVGEDGRLSPVPAPPGERVISTTTAAAVRAMLEEAVHGEAGTGGLARVDGYRVAGKTGTARKPSEGGAGYSNQYIATFVGMAPADDPRVVVAVMIDEPWPFYGGLTAAPVFAEVMQAALVALRVPPEGSGDDLSAALQLAAEHAARIADAEVAAADAAARAVVEGGPGLVGDAADDRPAEEAAGVADPP
ncbi:MAG: penicillin-binding protein 2 [Nitriliruptor sp.]|nr:MAG: penicillin-binding protein 2 [Nitriliruptor sp.]